MPQVYDVALIGAGPAAVAALAALPKDTSIAILTGAGMAGTEPVPHVHAKILSVARERAELPGIARPLPFEATRKSGLFDSAAIGGLANYWGQQFRRYDEGDPWPRALFVDYAEYLRACARIETLFSCTPGENAALATPLGAYVARTPNLLTGTAEMPSAGLAAMREAFRLLSARAGILVRHNAARGLEITEGHLRIHLDDGTRVMARKLLLAAGVVGSLRLVMTSCPEIAAIRLDDHAPAMLYLARRPGAFSLDRIDGLTHFNSLTIERIEQSRVRLFASCYRMSEGSVALVLASLGLPPLFARRTPPRLIDLVTPVQVWTEASRMRYCVGRRNNGVRLVSRPDPATDDELLRFRRWLADHGRILKLSLTTPGYGFHYHAGEVSLDGRSFQVLSHFLEQRFGGRVSCLDASILSEIGCRPHTLTAMAAAWKIAATVA